MKATAMRDYVLVTGGAHRLGQAVARLFAKAGWQVWCHYGQSQAAALALQTELAAQGLGLHLVQADLAQHDQVLAMMAHIRSQCGGLRAIVNNASLFEPDQGMDFDLQLMQRQLDVNLLAPMLLARELAQQQHPGVSAADAAVIHILDQKVFNLNPDYFSYTVSKLALERAVALQAQALAPRVRVCGVAPGLLYPSGPQDAENFARASRVNLLRRPINPDDVAATCVFLAQTPSINGTTLCVDNGQHLIPLARDVMFVA
jgi:NAD(P)-dependent dehydrogenase (short-subunit alcohol dehydrogenase family)